MSKAKHNRLKQRVLDICRGAGMVWDEKNQCWIGQTPAALQRAMYTVIHHLGCSRDYSLFDVDGLRIWTQNPDRLTEEIQATIDGRTND